MNRRSGFTIVELLVVIVVIGVLAAITIVSYSGISSKAIVSSIQADLSGNAKMLKLYYVEYGSYPTNTLSDASNCPTTPTADTKYCLKLSGSNSIDYYSGTSSGFTLRIKNGTTVYVITDNTASGQVTALTGIGDITGSTHIGSTLTAGTLSPAGSNATYQWQSATTSNGTYTNISGATSLTYVITSSDIDKYIKVVATGSGASYGTVTSNPTAQINGWVLGRTSSLLASKYVYYQDLGSTYQWKTSSAACSSPQCVVGGPPVETNGYYSNKPVLVANNGLDFSAYPARNACKSLGGRLPTIEEMNEIYNNKPYYGNNFPNSTYWTATEQSAGSALTLPLSYGIPVPNSVTLSLGVRCVKD